MTCIWLFEIFVNKCCKVSVILKEWFWANSCCRIICVIIEFLSNTCSSLILIFNFIRLLSQSLAFFKIAKNLGCA